MEPLQCKALIRKLLTQGVKLASSGGLKGVPKTEDDFLYEYTQLYFLLGKQTAALYVRALNELRLELVPSRADDPEVFKALWELFKEVVSDPAAYQRKGKLRERLNAFERLWESPLSAFQIAYSVDHLDLGSESISVGPVTFRTADENALAEWGVDEAYRSSWRSEDSRVGSRSIAYTQVEAADRRLVFETGKPLVLDAVNVLLLAALKGFESRAEIDELLQWRLNGHWAVKAADDESESSYIGYHRPFRPLVTNLSATVTSGLNALPVADLLGSALPQDIRDRLLRAVRWISHSVTHEGHDRKIVDLCTALEVMLLPNYRRGRKGEMIAVRYYLLGGFLNPPAMRRFYNLRSAVVHGAGIDIVGALDTWHLRSECYTVLNRLIQEAKSNPDVTTLEGLVAATESPARLTEFIDRCRRGTYEGTGIREIRRVAESRLTITDLGAD